MSAQSDRIRAALQRSEAARQSGEPRSDSGEAVKIDVNAENLAVLLGPKAPAPPATETSIMTPPRRGAPAAEVETTLPLIGASDQGRTARSQIESHVSRDGLEPSRPASAFIPEDTSGKPPTGGSRRMLLVLGLVIAIGGMAAFLLRNHRSSPKQNAQAAGLQMKADPQNNGLIDVRWNPQSHLIAQASEGRLVVSEPNQQPRTVALNPEQLKSGHVYYQSPADRIEFRLEVVSRSGAVSRESVLAQSDKPSATPPAAASPRDAPPPAVLAASAPTGAPNAPNLAANVDPSPAVDIPQNPQPSRPAARPYIPPQPNQLTPETPSTISLDPPPPAATGAAIAPSGAGLADRLNVIPQPPVVAPRIHVGGSVQAARLIKKVTPEYPALARAARARGTVRFTATIGKNGRIKDLQLISGNPTLVTAAADAVKQWVYQPSLLNGDPVEVITQIEVDFSANQ